MDPTWVVREITPAGHVDAFWERLPKDEGQSTTALPPLPREPDPRTCNIHLSQSVLSMYDTTVIVGVALSVSSNL